jgi:hypothetical protein
MIWPSLLAGLALLTALWALAKARRAGRRLDLLQQSYWDLRYEHGRLRAQVKQLDPEEAAAAQPAAPDPATTFIPLSSLKR